MTESEREKLVTDLANYVAMMAPHQKERMGGKLILRALEALKSMRVITDAEITHREGLLKGAVINPAWEAAKWELDFECLREAYIASQIQMQKELLTTSREASMTQHGPDTTGPDIGSADTSN